MGHTDTRTMKEKMRCRKGDMGCKKWEVRNMSFHAHIQFPISQMEF